MTLVKAVRLIIARKVLQKRHPQVATDREVRELRGVATTPEDIALAGDAISTGSTFYENYYTLEKDG